jgi:hypothetical protein
MRHTLNAIDPLPEFPSDSLSFELQDSEPAYQPCERHKRLPSYREVCEALGKAKWLRAVMQDCARNGITSWDSKQLYFQLDVFNGNCNPEITEADCRKRKDAPAEQPKQSTDATQFKVGDRVLIRAIASWARGMWGVITDESVSRGERVLIVTVAGGIGCHRERDLELIPAEPAPQEPQADAEGWIEWKGGKCPIPKETPVVVRLRDGSEYDGETAADWVWAHGDMDGDIVAYRIVA